MHCLNASHYRYYANTCSFLLLVLSLVFHVRMGRGEQAPGFAFSINSAQIPGGLSPRAIGTDPNGNVYVSSIWNVIKLDTNGSFIGEWGTQGTGPGQFSYSGSIAFDKHGHVFVLDDYNDRVEEFDTAGDFITAWGSHGSGQGQFDGADGLTVSSDGQIYVSDANNFRIQVFSSPGVFLKQFGSIGASPGQFSFPGPIAIDSSNNVYVLDAPGGAFDNFRVQKFDRTGAFLSQWSSHGSNSADSIELGGIATDPSNNVYVADGANNRVQKFTSDGVFLSQWGTPGNGPGEFNDPGGIAIDPSGNYLYVSDYYNARVNVFAYAGRAPLIFQPPTNQIVAAGETVSLQVGVFGAQPLTYQWHFGGTNIAGATNAFLVISNISLAASGVYSVSASNTFGMILSSGATLAVIPLIVTTLPAGGISATGALLQGSATVGSNLSSAWFEWGPDTNYGNTVGLTNLAANLKATIGGTLAGLNGDIIYHYRLAGSNALGLVSGEDVSFQVGTKPSVVTLPVVPVSKDTLLLSANVNPQGRSTRVYFRWGRQAYGYSTVTNELPSGVTSVSVQAPITNLLPAVTYSAQAVAVNDLGTVLGKPVNFIAPPLALLPVPPQRVWSALAASADGHTLIALANDNQLYSSRDSGITWTSNPASFSSWKAIAISADASQLLLGSGTSAGAPGFAYASTNLGATWVKSMGPPRDWYAMAASGDGLKIAAIDVFGNQVLISTNGGLDWSTNSPPASLAQWSAIASSADGQNLVVASGGFQGTAYGAVFTSADAGRSWTSNNLAPGYWQSVASSADGETLLVAGGGQHTGPIYYSTNAGISWTQATTPVTNWLKVAISADGRTFAALVRLEPNQLFISRNSGQGWESQPLPPAIWSDLVLSADGARLFASGDQNIVTLESAPATVLKTKAQKAQVTLSWVIPSAPLLLQQSADLSSTGWTGATATPTLILTNLQYELVLPATSSASFFRLINVQ